MPNSLRNPFFLGGLVLILAATAAVVVVAVLSEGEDETVVVIPPEETSAPTQIPTRTPAPLDGMRGRALSTLTVRAGPGTSYVSLGIVRHGAELEVVGKNVEESWLEISYPPRSQLRGWVTADDVELEGSIARVPMATPESLVLPVVPTYAPSTPLDEQPVLTPEVPPAPDLILSDAYVVEGQLVVTVTNQGTADAPAPIDIATYSGDASSLLRLTSFGDPLPAGASVELPTQYEPAGGPQRLLIRVDPGNRVAEMNEDNNEVLFGISGLPPAASPSPAATSLSPAVTVTPARGLPNLTPTPTTPSDTPTAIPTGPAPAPVPTSQGTSEDED